MSLQHWLKKPSRSAIFHIRPPPWQVCTFTWTAGYGKLGVQLTHTGIGRLPALKTDFSQKVIFLHHETIRPWTVQTKARYRVTWSDFRFYIWFSKSFVFLQQKKPGAQALTSCINGCGVANRQVEQAASGVCGHPPFFSCNPCQELSVD